MIVSKVVQGGGCLALISALCLMPGVGTGQVAVKPPMLAAPLEADHVSDLMRAVHRPLTFSDDAGPFIHSFALLTGVDESSMFPYAMRRQVMETGSLPDSPQDGWPLLFASLGLIGYVVWRRTEGQ